MTAKLWTVANAIMLALFALSVVVQYNDPDPIVWMAVYCAAAVLCGLEMRSSTPLWAALALALGALAWAGFIALRVHDVPLGALVAAWEMKDVRIEEAREMYGLTIVGVWMLAVARAAWNRSRGRRS
jgi:Transmembrane family 220, helix